MNPYIIGVIILLILAGAGFAVYYYLKIYKKPGTIEENYLWIGPGEHPFKGREGKE